MSARTIPAISPESLDPEGDLVPMPWDLLATLFPEVGRLSQGNTCSSPGSTAVWITSDLLVFGAKI